MDKLVTIILAPIWVPVWLLFRLRCVVGLHSGLTIKHWEWSEEHQKSVLTKHEEHCSVCNKITIKV